MVSLNDAEFSALLKLLSNLNDDQKIKVQMFLSKVKLNFQYSKTYRPLPCPSKLPRQYKLPRPPNSFILYRKDKQPEILAKYENISNNEVSKIVGQMWRNEPSEVK